MRIKKIENKRITPMVRKIIDLLSDGKLHEKEEIRKYIDEYSEIGNVKWYVYIIRDIIKEEGYTIRCYRHKSEHGIKQKQTYYQLVQIVRLE